MSYQTNLYCYEIYQHLQDLHNYYEGKKMKIKQHNTFTMEQFYKSSMVFMYSSNYDLCHNQTSQTSNLYDRCFPSQSAN